MRLMSFSNKLIEMFSAAATKVCCFTVKDVLLYYINIIRSCPELFEEKLGRWNKHWTI